MLLLGYKPVQHVAVLNTVGNFNTVVSILMLYIILYNLLGPPSYMRSVVDRNVVMRRIPIFAEWWSDCVPDLEYNIPRNSYRLIRLYVVVGLS